jgi:branched-chain amino acid transport system ATP-binding protein
VLHEVRSVGGEIAVVLGNGAVKTTIRAISGTIHRSGDVTFAGRSIVSSSAESIVRAGIAQVPQGRGTFPG